MEIKLINNTYTFDDWVYEPIYSIYRYAWVRFLRSVNGEPVVSSNLGLHMEPRIEIATTWTLEEDLYFTTKEFKDVLAQIRFMELVNIIYPFPQFYSPANDYELAKKRCDKFLSAINNLMIFT